VTGAVSVWCACSTRVSFPIVCTDKLPGGRLWRQSRRSSDSTMCATVLVALVDDGVVPRSRRGCGESCRRGVKSEVSTGPCRGTSARLFRPENITLLGLRRARRPVLVFHAAPAHHDWGPRLDWYHPIQAVLCGGASIEGVLSIGVWRV
jgi:hypothetical protein